MLLSQAATPIIAALPSLPPTSTNPYTGAQATGAARASLQRALDNYKTGHINLPPQSVGSELSRSDTRSFGETHASELSSISSEVSVHTHPGVPLTPPPGSQTPSQQQPLLAFKSSDIPGSPAKSQSLPIDPSTLNQSPAPIPTLDSNVPVAASPVPIVGPDPSKPSGAAQPIIPTIAETGIPVSAGVIGPGPANGSLYDIKGASATAGPRSDGLPGNEPQVPAYGQGQQTFGSAVAGSQPKYESAEAEKQRLQKEDRERLLASSGTPAQQPVAAAATTSASTHERAEDEKKRLEREERERILRRDAADDDASKKDEEDLPPYQD